LVVQTKEEAHTESHSWWSYLASWISILVPELTHYTPPPATKSSENITCSSLLPGLVANTLFNEKGPVQTAKHKEIGVTQKAQNLLIVSGTTSSSSSYSTHSCMSWACSLPHHNSPAILLLSKNTQQLLLIKEIWPLLLLLSSGVHTEITV
jgi:hypothetical protein